ncbi:hypothetical protein V5F53_08120 [Xanthobacter sp. V4C-4]|uniref:hypothetical protein n=1 Tax=Xanthobacter cornucopiae TaxID=3119924 RepID=UPI0037279401
MATKPPRRQAPATAGLARQLYAQGVPIADICARTGLSTGAAYHWIDREVGADGSVRLQPIGRRAAKTFKSAAAAATSVAGRPSPVAAPRARLLARLWRAAERQVEEIETRTRRVAGAEGTSRAPADSEKDARALALIARTLRELVAAEDDAAKPAKDADDTVRDLDEFRRELARRLERMREEQAGAGDPLSS